MGGEACRGEFSPRRQGGDTATRVPTRGRRVLGRPVRDATRGLSALRRGGGLASAPAQGVRASSHARRAARAPPRAVTGRAPGSVRRAEARESMGLVACSR